MEDGWELDACNGLQDYHKRHSYISHIKGHSYKGTSKDFMTDAYD